MKTEIYRNMRNPRWWVALPLVLLVGAFLIIMFAVSPALWWLGQMICRISKKISPHSPTPNWFKWIGEWVRNED